MTNFRLIEKRNKDGESIYHWERRFLGIFWIPLRTKNLITDYSTQTPNNSHKGAKLLSTHYKFKSVKTAMEHWEFYHENENIFHQNGCIIRAYKNGRYAGFCNLYIIDEDPTYWDFYSFRYYETYGKAVERTLELAKLKEFKKNKGNKKIIKQI